MPTIVAKCPRCGAQHMTFDVLADTFDGILYSWQSHHQAAVQCRRCNNLAVLKLSLRDPELKNDFRADGALTKIEGDLEPTFQNDGFLNVADLEGVAQAPKYVPTDITAAFDEGARCMSIRCYNAAASMFRLCLDLVTKPLLPDPSDEIVAQPTKRQRFNLGERIDWLMEHELLPRSLSELAHCVRQHGNDGAHDGSLGENDSRDLLDFTQILLERQFTEPERLRLAQARRLERRGASPQVGTAGP